MGDFTEDAHPAAGFRIGGLRRRGFRVGRQFGCGVVLRKALFGVRRAPAEPMVSKIVAT